MYSLVPVQALMHEETDDNYSNLFQLGTSILAEVWRTTTDDIVSKVTELHKDLRQSIENARRIHFPNARPCDDQTHVLARFAIQFPAKCKEPTTREVTQASARTAPDLLQEYLRTILLYCPSIDMLHVCLSTLSVQMKKHYGAEDAIKYLWDEGSLD